MSAFEIPARALDVEGMFEVTDANDRSFPIHFEGDSVYIAVPKSALRPGTLGQLPKRRVRRRALHRLRAFFERTELRLVVTCGDRVIGELNARSRGDWLSGLLGLSPFELRVGELIGALRDRRAE